MIVRVSKSVVSTFIAWGVIPDEDIEIYEYSFELLISSVLSFLAIGLIAAITRTVSNTVLYVLGFVPLRLIAGGYHAKSHFKCFLILMLSYAALQSLVFFLQGAGATPALLLVSISVTLVMALAPCPDSNKPISDSEARRFFVLSRITVVIYAVIISVLSIFLTSKTIGLSLALGVFTASISLLASYIKNKFNTR